MPYMWPHHWAGSGMIAMGILMFLFWILIVLGIIFVIWFFVGLARRAEAPPASPETPLEVLQKRYARGEITREQYQEMKRELEG